MTTLAVFLTAFIGMNAFAPQWSRAAGLDFWEMQEAVEIQKLEHERRQVIDNSMAVLSEQIAAGESVTDALLEARVSLAEATDQAVQINRDRPGFDQALLSQYAEETTKRARVERYLLDKISGRLANDPSRLAEVLARITCR